MFLLCAGWPFCSAGEPLSGGAAVLLQDGCVQAARGDARSREYFTGAAVDAASVAAASHSASASVGPADAPFARPVQQLLLPVQPGWNLLSLPFERTGGPDEVLYALWRGERIGPVWGWDDTAKRYEKIDGGFSAGDGFWAYYPADDLLEVTGIPAEREETRQGWGWTLLGPLSLRVDLPVGESAYEWTGEAYRRCGTLWRGRGYWSWE